MSSTSYGYDVRTERLRVVGLPELLAFLLALGVVCWLAFPRELHSTLRNARLDAVSLSYMQAWLKAKPDDYELRLLMARELIKLGRFSEADAQLAYVAGNDDRYGQEIAWLRLNRDFNRLMTIEPGNRAGTMLHFETAQQLDQQDWSGLDSEQRLRYARMALLLGEVRRAADAYQRIASASMNASFWHEKAAKTLLAHGQYRAAARSHMDAMQASDNYGMRRRYFLAALATLEAGGYHQEALLLASTHERRFYQDKWVLYRLMRLAQAGGNLAQAQRYAIRLLKLPDDGKGTP
ncbi:MAG: hypothetical protein MI745_07390 [Pseudomonadales bacterium]|nr:hypothetical protein [Pseudomonadales bacterium]